MLLFDKTNADQSSRYMANRQNNGEFLTYLRDIVFLIAGILLVFSLLFRVVVVSGPSMNQTLIDGDYILLLNNVFYGEPKHGDVIVACKESYDDGAPIIKRVIATEGQTVDIDFLEGIVYVDGVALVEAGGQKARVFAEVTKVYFTDYSDEELRAYLETDEAYDKAGAYAIQGYFSKYIEKFEGDYDNVVGFPWARIEEEVKKL